MSEKTFQLNFPILLKKVPWTCFSVFDVFYRETCQLQNAGKSTWLAHFPANSTVGGSILATNIFFCT